MAQRGAPDTACQRRSYLATSMGKMLYSCLDLPSHARHLCGCTYFGTTKGHDGPRAISTFTKWVPIVLRS